MKQLSERAVRVVTMGIAAAACSAFACSSTPAPAGGPAGQGGATNTPLTDNGGAATNAPPGAGGEQTASAGSSQTASAGSGQTASGAGGTSVTVGGGTGGAGDPVNQTVTLPPCADPTGLSIAFSPMYSAYDGKHTFQIPSVVNGVSGAVLDWGASDPSMVAIDSDVDTGGIMITILKAGTVTIQARAPSGCGTAQLTITDSKESDWEIGNARYNSNNPLAPINLNSGMVPMLPMNGVNPLEVPGAPPACTNCHGESPMGGILQSVSHTPQQTGGFTDAQLVDIFKNGIIPDGGYYDGSLVPKFAWSILHKWTVTPAEEKGLVVYLRSLPPKPQTGKTDITKLTGAGGSGSGGGGGTGGM